MASELAMRVARAIQAWAETTTCIMSSREEGIVHQANLIDAELASVLAEKDAEIERLRKVVDRDHEGIAFACSAHVTPDLECETCYTNLRVLLREHVE